MAQGPIRPIPIFEGASDFKIKRNLPATIVLPVYPGGMVIPPAVGIAMHRENYNEDEENLVETAPWQEPSPQVETVFELTEFEMAYIAMPDIKFITLQERYSVQSGGPETGQGEKSPPYEIID